MNSNAKISGEVGQLTQSLLDSINVEQARADNRDNLNKIGGCEGLMNLIGVQRKTGLTKSQVQDNRSKFGTNEFPESPMKGYFTLFLEALSDPTLLVLLAAAAVSLGIGIWEHPDKGWIEGAAIFIAVFLVANISAGNDYTKELQFRALESSSQQDERTSVFREGEIERINPKDLVVGDIVVLQAGDAVPADCILIDDTTILSNESSLTGEPDDVKKTLDKDCFLLSSCTITEGEECRAMVIGIGLFSQWGKIKANLVSESTNTPLQDKLEEMTTQIGYIGMVASIGVFIAMVVSIWTRHHGEDIINGFIHAFILAVTVVVVAIPEGLPLAVTISLAFSTKKMYKDQCFIRVLAACETMGNATCICSDKTGTLTENRMTVVEGWFGNVRATQQTFSPKTFPDAVKKVIGEHICINRTAYLVYKDLEGNVLDRPSIIGNKTEGALIMMGKTWGYEYENLLPGPKDKIYSFNSAKKRSTGVYHRDDGTVRVFCKGATEWVLKDCTSFLDSNGKPAPLTESKKSELEALILAMADMALRTLLLAHRDFDSASDLPPDWIENPPDNSNLCVDCIVGIIDPLRGDVKEAVATAQRAGVLVRMVTGDNVATARAIARDCGILTEGGTSVEGPTFRKMSVADVDKLLPNLQVMARSSPDDKFLLVTRLNGRGLPQNKEDWEVKHPGMSWDNERDLVLPGYYEEWSSTRPEGGHVVGVTGDGTNDAPALKAADVGLAMGITGTKVAQGASDIVILDDRFSSIVRAIMWGRCVYDNIRKFLQFQLTVNVVALVIVFVGACAGVESPLNAVQMLWVNLVMDTFGALALGTESPTLSLLDRKPYKRSASLVSRVMFRNILCQSLYQLVVCLVILFHGAPWFGVTEGVGCYKYSVEKNSNSFQVLSATNPSAVSYNLTCADFGNFCPDRDGDCFRERHSVTVNLQTYDFTFVDINKFEDKCLTCITNDYRHNTIIFNSFIFCQIFNEYTARKFTDWNMFGGLYESGSFIFMYVSIFTIGMQIILVEFAGDFLRTSPLDRNQWLISVGIGFGSLIIGVLMRFIPVEEDPNSFFDHTPISTNQQTQLAPSASQPYRLVEDEEL